MRSAKVSHASVFAFKVDSLKQQKRRPARMALVNPSFAFQIVVKDGFAVCCVGVGCAALAKKTGNAT
jgi:hypothetical protein